MVLLVTKKVEMSKATAKVQQQLALKSVVKYAQMRAMQSVHKLVQGFGMK